MVSKKIGFKVVDIEINEINGGSFSVVLSNEKSLYKSCDSLISNFIDLEKKQKLSNLETYKKFDASIKKSKEQLQDFVLQKTKAGKTICGLGASTKGNVLLQYCKFGPQQIKSIGEVNLDKQGKITPGTWIPIIPEAKVLAENPDFLLVLPWHFKKFFIANQKFKNRNLVFPLPSLEVVEVN